MTRKDGVAVFWNAVEYETVDYTMAGAQTCSDSFYSKVWDTHVQDVSGIEANVEELSKKSYWTLDYFRHLVGKTIGFSAWSDFDEVQTVYAAGNIKSDRFPQCAFTHVSNCTSSWQIVT